MRATAFAFLLASASCSQAAAPPSSPPAESFPEAESDAAPAPAPAPKHFAGAVELPTGQSLEYFVTLEPDGDGYRGTIDIPAQSVSGVPLAQVTVSDDGSVSFVLETLAPAKWSGEPGAAGTYACSFSQGPATLPCTMQTVTPEQLAEAKKIERPQTPKPPYPYLEEKVTYRNAKANLKLAGTLTIPKGEGPFPAVVLITGSGPQDRDETIFGHKPFAVIADHLTRKGVAVLRSDDRGIGGSEAGSADATTEDFSGDVEAAFDVLIARDDIDNVKIGLVGHSEGGVIAPMVAARRRDVAFIVLLAGPGVPGDDILVEQVGRTMEAAGAPQSVAQRAQQAQRKLVDIASRTGDEQKIRQELRAALIATAKDAGAPEPDTAEVDLKVGMLMSPWYRYFLRYDPAPTLKKVKVPVLALIGSLDTQVDADQNIPALEQALRRNKKATVEELPGLNHLFQPAETGGIGEYDTIETTIDPAVLERISTWIGEHV